MKSFNWTKGYGLCMCEWDGVGACAELWFWVQQEKRTDDSKETEEEEEGVRVSIELYSLKREKKQTERKKKKFSCWWTVSDWSIFPSARLSAQSRSIQYKSLLCHIAVYNYMVSSWCSYRWQALITTCVWSARTLNTRLVVMLSSGNTGGVFQMPCSSLTTDTTSWLAVTGEATASWDRYCFIFLGAKAHCD